MTVRPLYHAEISTGRPAQGGEGEAHGDAVVAVRIGHHRIAGRLLLCPDPRYNREQMALWMRKCSSFAEEARADREFWAQMTGRERVEALEDLRREAWKVTGERLEGLRRSVRVLERAPR